MIILNKNGRIHQKNNRQFRRTSNETTKEANQKKIDHCSQQFKNRIYETGSKL